METQEKIDAIAAKIGYTRDKEQATKFLPPDDFKPILHIRPYWRDAEKIEIFTYSPYFENRRYCTIYAAIARPLEQLAADIRRRAIEKFLDDVKTDRRRAAERATKDAQKREILREIFDAYGDGGKFKLNCAQEPTSLNARFSIKYMQPEFKNFRLDIEVNSKYALLQIIKILAAERKQ